MYTGIWFQFKSLPEVSNSSNDSLCVKASFITVRTFVIRLLTGDLHIMVSFYSFHAFKLKFLKYILVCYDCVSTIDVNSTFFIFNFLWRDGCINTCYFCFINGEGCNYYSSGESFFCTAINCVSI